MRRAILLGTFMITSLSLIPAHAYEFGLFGPKTFQRTEGKPDVYTETFLLRGLPEEGKLILQNGNLAMDQASSVLVYLNGKLVISPRDLNQNIFVLEKTVELQPTNTLALEMRSAPGSFVAITVSAITPVPMAVIPNIVGLQKDVATAQLTASSFLLGNVSLINHATLPAGVVISQSPSAGEIFAMGSPVDLVVSVGNIDQGVLLEGDDASLAINATKHYIAKDVETREDDYIVLSNSEMVLGNEFDMMFEESATVGDMNRILNSFNAKIVGMLNLCKVLTVRFPKPSSAANFETLVNRLKAEPSILLIAFSHKTKMDLLPSGFSGFGSPDTPDENLVKIANHIAVRAPAAWNARNLLLENPLSANQPVYNIIDYFGYGPLFIYCCFDVDSLNPGDFSSVYKSKYQFEGHGYAVLGVAFGSFNSTDDHYVTGIYPDGKKMPINGFELMYHSLAFNENQLISRLFSPLVQNKKFILNTSFGKECYPDPIDPVNKPAIKPNDNSCIVPGAVAWIEKIRSQGLEGNIFHATSAGNLDPEEVPNDASLNSEYAFAALQKSINYYPKNEPPRTVLGLNNTLVVEGRAWVLNNYLHEPGCLHTSNTFPYPGNIISAIGAIVWQHIAPFKGAEYNNGTSLSAPQVSGLASYLWSLKPSLSSFELKRLISDTARIMYNDNICMREPAPVIDAYNAILALDNAILLSSDGTPFHAPIRQEIFDIVRNGKFDEVDIQEFLGNFSNDSQNPDYKIIPTYARHDLNGDGFTGYDQTTRFNLDIDYPPTYSEFTKEIEDHSGNKYELYFDENKVTDMDVLCYYAYSNLYTGNAQQRDIYLLEDCLPTMSLKVNSGNADNNYIATVKKYKFGVPGIPPTFIYSEHAPEEKLPFPDNVTFPAGADNTFYASHENDAISQIQIDTSKDGKEINITFDMKAAGYTTPFEPPYTPYFDTYTVSGTGVLGEWGSYNSSPAYTIDIRNRSGVAKEIEVSWNAVGGIVANPPPICPGPIVGLVRFKVDMNYIGVSGSIEDSGTIWAYIGDSPEPIYESGTKVFTIQPGKSKLSFIAPVNAIVAGDYHAPTCPYPPSGKTATISGSLIFRYK